MSDGDGGSRSSRSSAEDMVPVEGVLGKRRLKSPECMQHTWAQGQKQTLSRSIFNYLGAFWQCCQQFNLNGEVCKELSSVWIDEEVKPKPHSTAPLLWRWIQTKTFPPLAFSINILLQICLKKKRSVPSCIVPSTVLYLLLPRGDFYSNVLLNSPTWAGGRGVHGPGLTAAPCALRVAAHPTMAPLTPRGPRPRRGLTPQSYKTTCRPKVKHTQKSHPKNDFVSPLLTLWATLFLETCLRWVTEWQLKLTWFS